MILKKSGNTLLNALRTIVLFPVDCNYAFKHIGREMMKLGKKRIPLHMNSMEAAIIIGPLT